MTYTLGIPAANLSPAVQQADLATNTDLANTYFGVDHKAYTDAADQGEHKQVTYTAPLAVAPAPAGTKAVLYTQTTGGQSELFYKNAAATYQLTPPGLAVFTPFAQGRFRLQAGTWQQAGGNTGFSGITANGDGNFTLSFSNPITINNAKFLITASSQTGVPANDFGTIGYVDQMLSNSMRVQFVNPASDKKDPAPFGFTVLLWL